MLETLIKLKYLGEAYVKILSVSRQSAGNQSNIVTSRILRDYTKEIIKS